MATIATFICVSSLVTVVIDAIGIYPAPLAPNYRTLKGF